jgi:hypothetical protein
MTTVLTIRPGLSVRPGVTLLGKGPVIDLNPDLFPSLIPVSSDGYTLSQLGLPDTTGTAYTIENGYIKYVVNGAGSGALGNGEQDSVVDNTNPTAGLQLDPYGRGNYGIDDFIDPGTPVEYYQFEINGGAINFIGNNADDNVNNTPTNTWQPAANRVVVQTGSEAEGFVVIQYLTMPNEPVIRIKMSYTNTTGSAVTLKAARGTDPDQDSFSHGSSSTDNLRGLGSIPGTDISYALGPLSGKAIAIYCPGDGYTHNTSIIGGNGGELYTYNINRILNNVDAAGNPVPNNIPDSDIGIACAWDVGTVSAGATVDLYCYYVLGNHIENLASKLGSRRAFTFTLRSTDFTNTNVGGYITSNGNTGFTTTGQSGPGEAVWVPILSLNAGGSPAKLAEVRAFWASNGLNPNTNSYMFNVTWGPSSTLSSGVVIMGLYDYGDTNVVLNMGVVDTTDPVWQTPNTGYYDGPIYTLAGTWNLPATFTLITPLITEGNHWC